VIRPGHRDDAAEITELYRALDKECPMPDALLAANAEELVGFTLDAFEHYEKGTYFVAAVKTNPPDPDGETLVGMLNVVLSTGQRYFPQPEYAHVADLYVHSDYRRKGIGTALIRGAKTWAELQGVGKLSLDVDAKNKAANKLFAKLDFEESFTSINLVKGIRSEEE